MSVIGLVPARSGSVGIRNKNFRPLAGGLSCVDRALLCARQAGIPAYAIFLSTDAEYPEEPPIPEIAFRVIARPAALAQDDTPMLAVVQHALAQIPGEPADIIVLLQPTAVFRTPEHIRRAIALLHETGADSVVSVVPTLSPRLVCEIDRHGRLWPWQGESSVGWDDIPTRRQEAGQAYKRDGTVYVLRRATVTTHHNLFGAYCAPLILDPSETCELDTEADWQIVESRWRARNISRP